MSKKEKTAETPGPKVYQPLYVQSSNPSPEFLEWLAEMGETRIVYLQSGAPPDPPPNPPGGGNG